MAHVSPTGLVFVDSHVGVVDIAVGSRPLNLIPCYVRLICGRAIQASQSAAAHHHWSLVCLARPFHEWADLAGLIMPDLIASSDEDGDYGPNGDSDSSGDEFGAHGLDASATWAFIELGTRLARMRMR